MERSSVVLGAPVRVVDSHTGGEPTRLVIGGGPDWGLIPAADRRARLRETWDHCRAAIILEPRGSDVLVGALWGPSPDPTCVGSVVFFNNVGYLGMCGHGLIGTVVSLAHLGWLTSGTHRLETPVGVVEAALRDRHGVSFQNVPSYRYRRDVEVTLDDQQTLHGDVAWGGNWFFLSRDHGEDLSLVRVARLTALSERIKQALIRQGITGEQGAEIDHIELLGPASGPHADGRNFVLCPGGAYDRSPCGTGTSAKVACMADEGTLAPGVIYRQESITGSVFEASYERRDGKIIPRITGTAYVVADATLYFDPLDPFRGGISR